MFKKINADAKEFIKALLNKKDKLNTSLRTDWINHCNELKKKYPIFIKEQEPRKGYVSTYNLVNEVSNQMTENDIYQFASSGTSVDIAMKTFKGIFK